MVVVELNLSDICWSERRDDPCRALFDEMLDRYATLERVGPSHQTPETSQTVERMRGLDEVPVRFVRA